MSAGRPKLDGKSFDSVIRKLEIAFARDCTVLEACHFSGISTTTYYKYFSGDGEYVEYADKFEALRTEPVFKARETVIKALKTDPDIALKYLERKRKKEFSTRTENENKTVTKFDELDDDQLEKVINATDKKTDS